jgi:hypothetical protein
MLPIVYDVFNHAIPLARLKPEQYYFQNPRASNEVGTAPRYENNLLILTTAFGTSYLVLN